MLRKKVSRLFKNFIYNHIINKFINSRKGSSFEIFFNLRSIIFQYYSRCKNRNTFYEFTDKRWPNKIIYCSREFTSSYFYSQGFNERVKYLEDTYMLKKIKFSKGDLIFDCGANSGDLKLFFDYYKLDIEYVAFEPSPEEFNLLQHNIHPSKAYNVGLWNKKGKIKFFVSSERADSSLIEPETYDELILVNTIKLEEIISRKVKLLKLEAEGAEPEIIEGALKSLKFIEYISADLGFERGKLKSSTFIEVTNKLLENNFEIVDVNHERLCVLYKNKYFC